MEKYILIQKACSDSGLPKPVWKSDRASGVTLTFFTPEVTPEVKRLLHICNGEMSRKELQGKLGLKDPDYFRVAYINPALQEKLVEPTIPESPRSPKQKYRLTVKGKKFVGAK